MPNRIEARSAKAALTNATGRLPLLRLFSTPLVKVGAPAGQHSVVCDVFREQPPAIVHREDGKAVPQEGWRELVPWLSYAPRCTFL
jgi:hypothetical protein